MPQVFRMQITYPDGKVVEVTPGGRLEIDLIERCVEAIVMRGVGIFRTEATVRDAIREGLREVFMSLKRRTLEVM